MCGYLGDLSEQEIRVLLQQLHIKVGAHHMHKNLMPPNYYASFIDNVNLSSQPLLLIVDCLLTYLIFVIITSTHCS